MPGSPQITPVAAEFGAHLADPSPFYAGFTGRGGAAPVQFHALIECDGPDAMARCRTVLASLTRRLGSLGGASLTTAINGAFQACHQELSAAGGPGVGVTLVAVRGEEVYLAAVADLAVFQLDRAGVRRVRPSTPGTLLPGLGNLPEVTPILERLDLQPGERALVCGASISAVSTAEGLEAVLSGSQRSAADNLAALMSNAPLFLGLVITAAE